VAVRNESHGIAARGRAGVTARERIAKLIDRDSQFLSGRLRRLRNDAEWGGRAIPRELPRGWLACAGETFMIIAKRDATVKAVRVFFPCRPEKKTCSAQEYDYRQEHPYIYLVDSAGNILPLTGGMCSGYR